jgi:hypothetical protein
MPPEPVSPEEPTPLPPDIRCELDGTIEAWHLDPMTGQRVIDRFRWTGVSLSRDPRDARSPDA